MDATYKKLLEKQHYVFVGEHSAVKICGWTKKSLTNDGSCYKGKFYGIQSHRCIQMSPAVNFCDMDCVYCWRDRNNSSFGKIDEPQDLMLKAKKAQLKLLQGYKGHERINMQRFLESKYPAHVAISLNGEPTYYPHLNHLIEHIHSLGWTTFLVTNGQRPDVLEKIPAPTQLYISLDGPTEETHKEITRAMRKDSWERVLRSLDIMRERRHEIRTVLRLTVVKGMTDILPAKHAELFKRANPLCIEVKGYVHVGASTERLAKESMPSHEGIIAFAKELEKYCEYRVIDDHRPSRVVLMMKQEDISSRYLTLNDAVTPEMLKRAQSGEVDRELQHVALETSDERAFVPLSSIKVRA